MKVRKRFRKSRSPQVDLRGIVDQHDAHVGRIGHVDLRDGARIGRRTALQFRQHAQAQPDAQGILLLLARVLGGIPAEQARKHRYVQRAVPRPVLVEQHALPVGQHQLLAQLRNRGRPALLDMEEQRAGQDAPDLDFADPALAQQARAQPAQVDAQDVGRELPADDRLEIGGGDPPAPLAGDPAQGEPFRGGQAAVSSRQQRQAYGGHGQAGRGLQNARPAAAAGASPLEPVRRRPAQVGAPRRRVGPGGSRCRGGVIGGSDLHRLSPAGRGRLPETPRPPCTRRPPRA
jgi:hypothetical protein